ncbi:GNAT family N-acetyltransferase [Henriciella litoralis]|uniref:GNAT family N-acetyltransferase n=1 Tax=Henriciella litoralis TaxID=568102 RepID=UPI00146C87A2|nr:GNAT family N-acetyltransferase [Henriciella litoralis]
MKYRLLRPEQMTEDLWTAFASLRDANSIYDDPFFDPDFARLVSRVRPDTRVGIAFDGDAPVGFWPLHRRPGAWARPIGGPFSDWHGPVLARDCNLRADVFLRGLGLLGMSTFGWLPQDEESQSRLTICGANMTDVGDDWDDFIEVQNQRWPKHFKKMRRLGRNIERDFSEVEFRFDDVSDNTISRLIELKREQFARTGRHDVLGSDWAGRFLDELRQTKTDRFRLRHVSIHFDGKHAASELLLQSDKVMHGWITAYEQDYAPYSPGNVLVQWMLEQMSAADGPKIYDAGPGLDYYKRHYSNYQLPIGTGVVRSKTFALRPDRLLGQAWRSGERLLDGRVSNVMTQSRRRLDQICLSELDPINRLKGLRQAARRTVAALELAESD